MDLHFTAFLVLIAPPKGNNVVFSFLALFALFSSRGEDARNFDEWVKIVKGKGAFVKLYRMIPCALVSWSILS